MGTLDRHIQSLKQKPKLSVIIKTSINPDTFYKKPGTTTWAYQNGVLTTGTGDQTHAELNFDRHHDLPSGRVSEDGSYCAVWARSEKDVYLTEWFNAFSALYNKGVINDSTVVGSDSFSVPLSQIFKSHFSNEESNEKENFFSVYSVRQASFEKYCQQFDDDFISPDVLKESGNSTTFLYIGGKMYYANGSVPHFQVIRKQVPPDVFKANSENYSSGRYSNDGKVVAVWDLLAKADTSLNHQAIQELATTNKIKKNATVFTYPDMTPVPLQQYMGGLVTAQFNPPTEDDGNEDYMGGWEEKEQVSTEVRHYFNNGGESIRNTLGRVETINHDIAEFSKAFPKEDKFMNTIVRTVGAIVQDLKEISQVFYQGSSGILNLKVGFKTAQQKRQISIHPVAYKTRNKLGLLAYDLHALGNELLFEYNGSKASDTNMADDARVFQWECAYAIGMVNNYIKDINDLYTNLSWLDYKANPRMYDFFSSEDAL